MKQLVRAAVLFPLAALYVWAQTGAGLFGGAEAILAELSKITGFKLLGPVKQEKMARGELQAFFEARIKEVVKPEEIRIEELVLKKIGFAPPDFDLKKTTVDLMTEQAAAFYDYRGRRMVLLEGGSDAMQQAALVHELAHALADQHFRLEKFLGKVGESDDASLARTAVMEGQATWLMSEFLARKMGRSLADSPEMMEMMSRMTGGESPFPVLASVPLYMRESLVFPYTKGMRFQHEVTARLGASGFAAVFRKPPETTREVLHPEVYFDGFRAATPAVPEPSGGGWRKIADGTVGEFDVSVLMQQYAFTELDAAKAWRGGRYRLFEHKRNKSVVLGLALQFADEGGAREFFRGYKKVLAKKWKQCRFSVEEESRLEGAGDDGRFVTQRDGVVVTTLEGLE